MWQYLARCGRVFHVSAPTPVVSPELRRQIRHQPEVAPPSALLSILTLLLLQGLHRMKPGWPGMWESNRCPPGRPSWAVKPTIPPWPGLGAEAWQQIAPLLIWRASSKLVARPIPSPFCLRHCSSCLLTLGAERALLGRPRASVGCWLIHQRILSDHGPHADKPSSVVNPSFFRSFPQHDLGLRRSVNLRPVLILSDPGVLTHPGRSHICTACVRMERVSAHLPGRLFLFPPLHSSALLHASLRLGRSSAI